MRALTDFFLYWGLLLLPFSTSKDGRFGVVVFFGLPCLLLLGALVPIYLLEQSSRGRLGLKRNLYSITFISAGYVASMLLFSFVSPMLVPSLVRAVPNLIGYFIFLYLVSFSVLPIDQLAAVYTKVSRVLSASGTVLAIYFIGNIAVVSSDLGIRRVLLERYVGGAMSLPWGASNTIAAILLLPLISTACLRRFEARSGLGGYVQPAVMFLAILLTMSRGALCALLAALALFFLTRKNYKLLIFVLVIAAIAISAFYWGDHALFAEIWAERASRQKMYEFNGRSEIWHSHLQYFLKHPFEPIGYYASLFTSERTSSHNLLLTTLLEQGIAGLALVLGLFVSAARWSLAGLACGTKRQRDFSALYLCGFFAIFINLQVEDANFTLPYIIYFWIFLGLSCLARRLVSEAMGTSQPVR